VAAPLCGKRWALRGGAATEGRPYKVMADDPTPNLERYGSYERACREFRWQIPEYFNIAAAILSRHSDAVTRVALVEARPGGLNTYTYGGLDYLSDKFATALKNGGMRQGDPVAVILPQSAASIIAQLGALKLGAVVVPLKPNLDASTLEFALKDSGARAAVIHHTFRERLRSIIAPVETVFLVNKLKPVFEDISPDRDFWREVFETSADFTSVETPGQSPAFEFYAAAADELVRATHSHASLIYQLPAFEMCNDFHLGDDSAFWTPWDWESVDSSLCLLYPALWYGKSVVACEARVTNSDSWSLIERCEITDLFANAGEIEGLRQSSPPSFSKSDFKLRNIVVTEPVPTEAYDWATDELGASVNTLFCNSLFGSAAASCNSWYETPRGSVGRAAPGYRIEIVDEHGKMLPPNSEGRVATRRDEQRSSVEPPVSQAIDASDPAADWVVSGTVGFKDEEGNLWPSESGAG
jgi:acetyl-CoA synthetase